MLIEDVTGRQLILEFNESLFKQAVNDLILKARMANVKEVKVGRLIGEIGKEFPDIYFDPNDLEIRDKVLEIISKNDWANMEANIIHITQPGDVDKLGKEPGKDVEQEKKERDMKANKIATKNIKQKFDNGGSELKI